MSRLLVCVPGDPVGKGRPRVGRRGRHVVMYTPEKTATYEQVVRDEAAKSMQGRDLVSGPVLLELQVYMPIPASYSKKKQADAIAGRLLPTKKPDLDNVVKAICDAFNGVVWLDDTQVVDLHVTKRYAVEACVIAIVVPIKLSPTPVTGSLL